ncbi:MAG: hypothetical protein JWN37_606 [Candidatus Nomurabacteria bacterium]|nr:hypothetical protein [Candidatus Nomurabacteria bacterium]
MTAEAIIVQQIVDINNFLKLLVSESYQSWWINHGLEFFGILVTVFISIRLHFMSKRLSAKDKFEHEKEIMKEISKIPLYQSIVLSDVKKYTPFRTDYSNQTYYKQGAELYTCIPEFGVQVILMPRNNDEIPVGLIPFDWIEIIREHDSEDNKPIIVCKFKGVRWHKNFKSPFKEINYLFKNNDYQEGHDPKFLMYTTVRNSTGTNN